jgi:hypothetical protein
MIGGNTAQNQNGNYLVRQQGLGQLAKESLIEAFTLFGLRSISDFKL